MDRINNYKNVKEKLARTMDFSCHLRVIDY